VVGAGRIEGNAELGTSASTDPAALGEAAECAHGAQMTMGRGLGSVWVATGVCGAAGAALTVAVFGPTRLGDSFWLVQFLLGVVPLGLGWLLVVRAPTSPVGAALAWLAAFMLATPAVEAWGATEGTGSPWWGSGVMAVVGAGAWPWQLVGFLALLLVFPDGLLPGRLWRVVAALVPTSAILVNAGFVLTMNYHVPRPAVRSPVSVPEAVWLPVQLGALGFLLAVVVTCGASVVVRYRRGGDRTRQQLRWLLLAAGGVVVLMVGSWGVVGLGWAGPGAYSGFLLGILVLVPAAVAIAVLRHDLFEIDRILSDSVAWLLTTVIAAMLLAGSVVLIGYIVGRDSLFGLTGAVFLVALAFLPLHRRLHQIVGRVLDRDRTVLVERIRRFVDRVRDGSAEPESVEEVLRSATGDPDLRLLLTDLDGLGYVDLSGEPAPALEGVRVPLRTAEAEVGVVMVGNGSMRRLRRARLAASAARLPIEVSRLRLGLRRALTDVDDSRRRLVSATIDERRRLERDLHDGTQQQLVAVGMQLRAAQRRLPPDHPVVGELDRAVESLEQTVGELRRLAHGVRPASLDDGLPAALRRIAADCPVPVDFTVADVQVSEVVATTAYFVVVEAIANVLKHAGATRIRVAVHQVDGGLSVSVADDGVGGAPAESGLTALRDRVGSVGGRLAVTSAPLGGTTIEAVLPCA
jgi:signal transduction histidine kinase